MKKIIRKSGYLLFMLMAMMNIREMLMVVYHFFVFMKVGMNDIFFLKKTWMNMVMVTVPMGMTMVMRIGIVKVLVRMSFSEEN